MTQGDKEIDKTEAEKREALEYFAWVSNGADENDHRLVPVKHLLIFLSPPPVTPEPGMKNVPYSDGSPSREWEDVTDTNVGDTPDTSSKASLDDSDADHIAATGKMIPDASGLLPETSYFELANGYPHNNEVESAIRYFTNPAVKFNRLSQIHMNVLLSAGRQYIKEGTRSTKELVTPDASSKASLDDSEGLLPCPFWWADYEEGSYKGPFNSREDAIKAGIGEADNHRLYIEQYKAIIRLIKSVSKDRIGALRHLRAIIDDAEKDCQAAAQEHNCTDSDWQETQETLDKLKQARAFLAQYVLLVK